MNRKERRAADRQRESTRLARAVARGYSCPDCSATKELVQTSPGVLVLEVRHDDTCPELARRGGHR